MNEEVFIEFLRKVSKIPTNKILYDLRGRAYAEESAPDWFDTLVDAAKDAVKKIEEAKK